MKPALYTVIIGYRASDVQTDNYTSGDVIARTAKEAIRKIRLSHGEYVAEVRLVKRLEEKA